MKFFFYATLNDTSSATNCRNISKKRARAKLFNAYFVFNKTNQIANAFCCKLQLVKIIDFVWVCNSY